VTDKEKVTTIEAVAELHDRVVGLGRAIAAEALAARGPIGWYARLLMRLRGSR